MTTVVDINPSLDQELLKRLRGLQDNLDDLRRERNLRTGIGVGGFVVIMIVLGVFFYKLQGYVSNYPADQLTRALGLEAENLLTSPETLALAVALREQAGAALAPALARKLEADMPKFQAETQALTNDMEKYLNTEISPRAARQLSVSAQQIYAGLLKEFSHLPADRIKQEAASAQAEYAQQLQGILSKYLTRTSTGLQGMQNSFARLSHDEDYDRIKKATPEQVETNFYAAVLELALYGLQPGRGEIGATPAQAASTNTAQDVNAAGKTKSHRK
jgi:hypothetical protein